ncbi:MAG: hypothetical protein Q6373_000700 [Candidatus Sigynarchaeota archaeon]
MDYCYMQAQVVTGITATSMLAAGFVLIFKQFVEKRYRPSLYLSIAWLGFVFESLFDTLHVIAQINGESSVLLLRISYLSLAPGFLGFLAFVDSIYRDEIEAKRFAAVVFFLGITTILLFIPDDELALNISYNLVISLGLLLSIYAFILTIKIYRNVPASLKRAAGINVLGSINVSILYVVFNVFQVSLPGAFPPISRLFEAAGALIQTIVFAKNVQLFNILPFRIQRLIVYDTKNGFSLFVHDWFKEGNVIDENLLTGILHGISMIVNESIQKGNVQELKMERGVLLINHDNVHTLAFVIIASRSSLVLNQALAAFRRKFVERFGSNLDMKQSSNGYESAKNLVKESFPFIPQYA